MKNNSIIPVILCGGNGTRLWPLSRESFPKQYLKLLEPSNKTMVQTTYNRLLGLKGLEKPFLICNEKHRFIVAEQFREINIVPKSIILEPFGRNTAPAITLAALKAIETGLDPTLLVLSSDHQIESKNIFQEAVMSGIEYCNSKKLITFGVVPTSAETGYGYIKIKKSDNSLINKAFEIDKFIEKPNLRQAKNFVKDKNFLWNSGIFMFKASVILEEIKRYNPEIFINCKKSLENKIIDLDFLRVDSKFFKKCPNKSVDVSVMENTKIGYVIPIKTHWSDLGNWNSIWLNSKKNNSGNVTQGNVILKNSSDCYLRSESRLLVGLGLKNIILIETPDAILLTSQTHSQEVKNIVTELKEKKLIEGKEHKLIYRPWGNYTSIAESEFWKVKKIIINPKQSLSLQSHKFRSEHWVVVSGEAMVRLASKNFKLKKNESIYIPVNVKHKLSNHGDDLLILIEVQSGSYLGEDDIRRFEDNYGRVKNNIK